MAQSIYDFTLRSIEGKEVNLKDYEGKTLVIVNVASKCGLTPQYAELQNFYESYRAKGVEVLGFPANNFGAQEPGTEAEIQQFCTTNYSVSFPMFSKISVKGDDRHELYQFLTEAGQSDVSWNFQKFVVGKDGQTVKAFAPQTSVGDAEFQSYIREVIS